MRPEVSIIIPVYNGEKFIHNCIKSVVSQTLKELQIIVVDDGSKDNTLKILKSFDAEDERITIIHQENSGVSKARNTGLQVVCGKWIIFIDSDDNVAPDYCSTMVNAAERLNADVVIAHEHKQDVADIYVLNEKDKLIQACLSYDEMSYPFNIDAPWGKIFRSSIIQKNQIIFPEELTRSEDAFFCLRFYEAAEKIGIFNKFGYFHAEREGSLCRCFAPDAPQTLEKVLSVNYQWVMKNHAHEKSYIKALWYRVLPGIVECERMYFLHPDFSGSLLSEYQGLLNQNMVSRAIHSLKLSDIESKQYKIRLLFYKLRLGRIFISVKKK